MPGGHKNGKPKGFAAFQYNPNLLPIGWGSGLFYSFRLCIRGIGQKCRMGREKMTNGAKQVWTILPACVIIVL